MLTVARVKTISNLALPVAVALSSTLVMALIDLAMVGRLGNTATAAVGMAVFSYAIALALVEGIVPAVQGLVARRRGEGAAEPACLPLNGGLLIAVAVGVPLTIGCYLLTPFYFSMIAADPGVTKIGIPFLKTMTVGIVAAGMTNAFDGFWAGMEKPRVYMSIALLMNCLNALGDYVLIFGHFGAPALGATGSALSTVGSIYLGVLINAAITYRRFRHQGFLHGLPAWSCLASVLRLGVPATVMQIFFFSGYLVFLWLVGQVGTAELAAANVLVRISMVLSLLSFALGSASATLVSKTLGAGHVTEAAEWGWDAAKLGLVGISVLGLPLLLFPQQFLSLFLTAPHTIAIAVAPLRLVAATAGIGGLVFILTHILYSVGDGNRVTMISFLAQWFFCLPAVWFVGPHLHHGLLQIWLVQVTYGLVVTALITSIWIEGRWKTIKI